MAKFTLGTYDVRSMPVNFWAVIHILFSLLIIILGRFGCTKIFLCICYYQKGTKLKCLRTDNRGEFVSVEFKSFCDLQISGFIK